MLLIAAARRTPRTLTMVRPVATAVTIAARGTPDTAPGTNQPM